MKIIVTTSNLYGHLLPIFCFLFNHFWGEDQEVEIVGYKKPNCELPKNFSFISMGEQIGGPENFGTDLRKYFEKQDQHIIWLMEDAFLRGPVNREMLKRCKYIITKDSLVGRISLTNYSYKEYDKTYCNIDGSNVYKTSPKSEYRLSTQPAIWNKDFLLRYLIPGLNPWQFECQEKIEDEFYNLCLEKYDAPLSHNEGVRKWNLYEYNFEGISEEMINEMKQLRVI